MTNLATATGMHRDTGAALGADTLAHLRQSITDILTTPIGTRVMRRDYGSRLFSLIDMPMNSLAPIQVYAATAAAIERWEPRLKLMRVQMQEATVDGRMSLMLEGVFVPTGQPLTLSGVTL